MKILKISLLLFLLISISGCDLIFALAGQNSGYNLSACNADPDVCYNLVYDNWNMIQQQSPSPGV